MFPPYRLRHSSGLVHCAGEAWGGSLHQLGCAGLGSSNLQECACQRPHGETVLVGCTRVVRRIGSESRGCAHWACVGRWTAWARCRACDALWRACVGHLLRGAVGGASWCCPWWACASFRVGRGQHVAGRGVVCNGRVWATWWRVGREGQGMGGRVRCGRWALVFARGGAHVWCCVGLVSSSSHSSAALASILQMRVCTWCSSWSVVGEAYFRGGVRPTRQKNRSMVW